jgi:hypothetical protein
MIHKPKHMKRPFTMAIRERKLAEIRPLVEWICQQQRQINEASSG